MPSVRIRVRVLEWADERYWMICNIFEVDFFLFIYVFSNLKFNLKIRKRTAIRHHIVLLLHFQHTICMPLRVCMLIFSLNLTQSNATGWDMLNCGMCIHTPSEIVYVVVKTNSQFTLLSIKVYLFMAHSLSLTLQYAK